MPKYRVTIVNLLSSSEVVEVDVEAEDPRLAEDVALNENRFCNGKVISSSEPEWEDCWVDSVTPLPEGTCPGTA